jgi:hypothetical protein
MQSGYDNTPITVIVAFVLESEGELAEILYYTA